MTNQHDDQLKALGLDSQQITAVQQLIATTARDAKVEGIKLVNEALLDDVTGFYPVNVVRNLIKMLVWENSDHPEQRQRFGKDKNV